MKSKRNDRADLYWSDTDPPYKEPVNE